MKFYKPVAESLDAELISTLQQSASADEDVSGNRMRKSQHRQLLPSILKMAKDLWIPNSPLRCMITIKDAVSPSTSQSSVVTSDGIDINSGASGKTEDSIKKRIILDENRRHKSNSSINKLKLKDFPASARKRIELKLVLEPQKVSTKIDYFLIENYCGIHGETAGVPLVFQLVAFFLNGFESFPRDLEDFRSSAESTFDILSEEDVLVSSLGHVTEYSAIGAFSTSNLNTNPSSNSTSSSRSNKDMGRTLISYGGVASTRTNLGDLYSSIISESQRIGIKMIGQY